MTKLLWLTPEAAQAKMEMLMPFFQRVVDAHPYGSYTIPGILFKAFRGEWMIWLIQDDLGYIAGVSATEIATDMKHHRVMRIMFLAGDGWLEWGPRMLGEFEASAAKNDIYATEFVGREGFGRKLPEYQTVGTIYRKVVNTDATLFDVVKPNVLEIGRA